VRNLTKVIGKSNSQTLSLVEEIRKLTNGYSPPTDANGIFGLFQRLAGLEKNLHRHLHLENEVLFRRAAELEGEIQ
jgi:regulator of cell morphogenesis and NO signaling